jgi:hypothetical protein
MACSKLFSGDLPEISTYIIQNLHNNINTLYSLALVNRFWCRLAIPLLWEDPFSIKYQKKFSFHFLDTYFLFLNDCDKSKLKEIISYEFDSNLQKPLFNYPSLIKSINSFRIHLHVGNWAYDITSTSPNELYSPLTLTHCYELQNHIRVDKRKVNVICTILFKLFMENNVSLNTLYMVIRDCSCQTYNDIYDMLPNNSTFVSEIFHFKFYDYRLDSQLSNNDNYK